MFKELTFIERIHQNMTRKNYTVNTSSNTLLTLGNGSHDEFPLGREPKPIVQDFREFLGEFIPQSTNFSVKGESLKVHMGGTKNGSTRSFIAPFFSGCELF